MRRLATNWLKRGNRQRCTPNASRPISQIFTLLTKCSYTDGIAVIKRWLTLLCKQFRTSTYCCPYVICGVIFQLITASLNCCRAATGLQAASKLASSQKAAEQRAQEAEKKLVQAATERDSAVAKERNASRELSSIREGSRKDTEQAREVRSTFFAAVPLRLSPSCRMLEHSLGFWTCFDICCIACYTT